MDDNNLSSNQNPSDDYADASARSSERNGSVRLSMHAAIALSNLENEDLSNYHELEDEYIVGEQIGRGGCAVVIEAWRKSDNMHVVIKVLQVPPGFDEHETHIALARFMREAELIASLNEDHIVKCVDYGCFQGVPCMVLEFVDGSPLDVRIRDNGPMPLETSADITIQLLSALAETHSQKIIHRDIKPANIMVLGDNAPFTIKVLDFGISSVLDGFQTQTLMTQQGSIRGTPSYMAPELFTGETHASIESDLYAVGLVFLECLTAEIAFNDKSCMQVAYKQVNEELEIPSFVPPSIAVIIARLCEKNAIDRYHSALDVIEDIKTALPQALLVLDKCRAKWEKEQKSLGGKKSKKTKSRLNLTTIQKWYKRPKTLLFVLAVAIIIFLLLSFIVYQQRKNDELIASQNTDVSQNNIAANDKLAAEIEERDKKVQDLQNELNNVAIKAAIKDSVGSVYVSFADACNDLADFEKSELEKAELEKKKASNKSAQPAATKKPKDRRPRDTKVKAVGIF